MYQLPVTAASCRERRGFLLLSWSCSNNLDERAHLKPHRRMAKSSALRMSLILTRMRLILRVRLILSENESYSENDITLSENESHSENDITLSESETHSENDITLKEYVSFSKE